MKHIALFLAEGFEEIEALTAVDLLRRAEIPVLTYSLEGEAVRGRSGITVLADRKIGALDLRELLGVVLPGGYPAYVTLGESVAVERAARYCRSNNLLIAAICGAPSALKKWGIVNGNFTVYPTMAAELGAKELPLVKDDSIITANGAAASLRFALAIIEHLKGKQTAEAVSRDICG